MWEKPYLSNLNFGKYEQALQHLEDDSLENMKLLNNWMSECEKRTIS